MSKLPNDDWSVTPVYTEQFLAKCKTLEVDEDKPFHDIHFEVKF